MTISPIDVLLVSAENRVLPDVVSNGSLRTVVVQTVETAIEKMQSIDFDVIIADIDLPGEDLTKLFRLIELQQPDALAVRANFASTEALQNTMELFVAQVAEARKKVYNLFENPFQPEEQKTLV